MTTGTPENESSTDAQAADSVASKLDAGMGDQEPIPQGAHVDADPQDPEKYYAGLRKIGGDRVAQTTAPTEDVHHKAGPEGNGAAGEPVGLKAPAERIPFHPLANIFPPLNDDGQRELDLDVVKNGQLAAIDLYENKILDGRGRYLACILAGIEPRFENYAGNDPLGFLVSRNLCRRHLDESQRAMVAARITDRRTGANQHTGGVPIGRASEILNVSKRSVARGKTVLRHGGPDLIKAVETGSKKVSAAAAEIRLAGPDGEGHAHRSRPGRKSPTPKVRSPVAAENKRLKSELATKSEELRNVKADFESFRQAAALKVVSPANLAEASLEAPASRDQ
jgi:hypothetical protein